MLFSHFGRSILIDRKSMETLSDDLIATKDSWLVEDETLMNSHGPITDYIDFKHGSLLAKGIGKESKVI